MLHLLIIEQTVIKYKDLLIELVKLKKFKGIHTDIVKVIVIDCIEHSIVFGIMYLILYTHVHHFVI